MSSGGRKPENFSGTSAGLDTAWLGESPAASSGGQRRGGIHRRSRRRKTLSPSKMTSFMDGIDFDDPASFPDIPSTSRSSDFGEGATDSAAGALVASPLKLPNKSPVQDKKISPQTMRSTDIDGEPLYANSNQIDALFGQSTPQSKVPSPPPLGVLDALGNQQISDLSGEMKSVSKKGMTGARHNDTEGVMFEVENLHPIESRPVGDDATVAGPAKTPLSNTDEARILKQTSTAAISSVGGDTGGGEAVRPPAPAAKRKTSRSSRRRSIVMPSEATPFIDSAIGGEGTPTTNVASVMAPTLRGGKTKRSSKHSSNGATASIKTAEGEFPLTAVTATSCLSRPLAVQRGWKAREGDVTKTLVRAYYSTAQGSQRARRIAARLFCLTGFCLLPQSPDDARVLCEAAGDSLEWGLEETGNPRLVTKPCRRETREQKRELVLRIKPLFILMDQEAKADKLAVERATGLVARKASPDGYCYEDQKTGESVDPAVYQVKYMEHIRTVSAARCRGFALKRMNAPTAVLSEVAGGVAAAEEAPATAASVNEMSAYSVAPAVGVNSISENMGQVVPRNDSSVIGEPSGEPPAAVVKIGGMVRGEDNLEDGSREEKLVAADVDPVTAHTSLEARAVAWAGVGGSQSMEAAAELHDEEGLSLPVTPEVNAEGDVADAIAVDVAADTPIATAEEIVDGKITLPAMDKGEQHEDAGCDSFVEVGNEAVTNSTTSIIADLCVSSPSVDIGAQASSAPTPAQPELDPTSASDASVSPLVDAGKGCVQSFREASVETGGGIKNAWSSRGASSAFVVEEVRPNLPERSESPTSAVCEHCPQPACSTASQAVTSLPPSRERCPPPGTPATGCDDHKGSDKLLSPLSVSPVSFPVDADDMEVVQIATAIRVHNGGVAGGALVAMARDFTPPDVRPATGGTVAPEVALCSQDLREEKEELAALEERLHMKLDAVFKEYSQQVERVMSRRQRKLSSPATSPPSREMSQMTTSARSSPIATTRNTGKQRTPISASRTKQDARSAAAAAAVKMIASSSPTADTSVLEAASCPAGVNGAGPSSPLLPSSAVGNADEMMLTPCSPLLPLLDLRLSEEDEELFGSSCHEEAGLSTVSSERTRRRSLRQAFSSNKGKHGGGKQQHEVGLNGGVTAASEDTRDREVEGSDGGVCGLCCKKENDTLLRPCEHVACGLCAERLRAQAEHTGEVFSCPWDRQPVAEMCPL